MKKIKIAPAVHGTFKPREGSRYQIAVALPLDCVPMTTEESMVYTEARYVVRTMVRTHIAIPYWVSVQKTDEEDRGFWHWIETDLWHNEGETPTIVFEKPHPQPKPGEG